MARKHLIKTSEYPYHVWGRANNKEWFRIPMEECWSIFEHALSEISRKYNAQIVSFVLMSNHFHMILWTPGENLDQIMHHLMKGVSCRINKRAGRINHLFGSRYKWSLIKEQNYFEHAYRYVYQNPLSKGLVSRVEDYAYSTLYKISRNQKLNFPIYDDKAIELTNIKSDIQKRLEWLNIPYTIEQRMLITRCLKRSTFTFPKHHKYKKIIQPMEKIILS